MSFEENYYQGMTGIVNPGIGANTYQRRLAESSERQVALLERRDGELRQTNDMLAREAEQSREQAIALHEDSLRHQEMMAAQTVASVQELEYTMSGHLGEMRWLLAQQGETLKGALDALRNRRRTEAQELVRQGVRHQANGEHAEAEDRFLKALDYDTTDYQVLFNLGFVAVHKNDPPAALTFFTKALKLPAGLDAESKARVLWEIARCHYAQGEFGRAFQVAEEALNVLPEPTPRNLFDCGTYAGLAQRTDIAIKRIQEAISRAPDLMELAKTHPDLECIRGEVAALVSALEHTASVAKTLFGGITGIIGRCKRAPGASEYLDIFSQLDSVISSVPDGVLTGPSYPDCVTVVAAMPRLVGPLKKLQATLLSPHAEMAKVGRQFSTARPSMTEQHISEVKDRIALCEDWSLHARILTVLTVIGLAVAPLIIKGAWGGGVIRDVVVCCCCWGLAIAAAFLGTNRSVKLRRMAEVRSARLAPFENDLRERTASQASLAAEERDNRAVMALELLSAVEKVRQDFDKAWGSSSVVERHRALKR